MPDQEMNQTAVKAEPTDETEKAPEPQVSDKKIADTFKSRVESSKRERKNRFNEMKRCVDLRLGRVASTFTAGVGVQDEIQTEINPDWSLTKTKTANLYSQVPTVQMTHENKQYAAAIPPFAKALNYEIGSKRANIGVAMEEVLNDTVNAAGIGAIIAGYAARFEMVDMPAEETLPGPNGPIPTKSLPPQMMQQLVAAGAVHMVQTPRVVSDKLFTTRISPANLLTPSEFTGSCFDDGDWVGHTGEMSWADAKNELKLDDADKDKVLSGNLPTSEDLRAEPNKGGRIDSMRVRYDEIYYWRHRVDPEEKHFKAIWKLVFVHGLTEPSIHEPWKGQKLDEQSRKYVGATIFPIQVLTLTYITDNPIPPSDSSAGRPQVNDMRRSRSQMFQNRERSIPLRWYDVNRIDPLIQDNLMRGTWQGMIPTNGDGSRSIGEIARASYPSEDMAFDQAAKADLMELWQIGPNQMGTSQPGRKTSAETNTVQQNFATRIGQERGRVAAFFLKICEVLSGLMVLYSDFPILTDQERQAMQQAWDSKHILHDLVFKIRPDSTIVLDVNQRLERIFKFMNMTVKSGYVNVKPLIIEAAELSGIDPSEVIIDPQPKKPEEPNISMRFTGKDDLMNPVVMAMLLEHITPEKLAAAKKVLTAAQQPLEADTTPPPAQAGAGAPGAPVGHPPSTGGPPAEGANKDWNLMPKVSKRSRDMGGNA